VGVTGSNPVPPISTLTFFARWRCAPCRVAVADAGPRRLSSASFSRDGTRIVTCAVDQTAKVWDARTGIPLLELQGPALPGQRASFSADGTRIVTCGRDAKVWDARTFGLPLDSFQQTIELSGCSFTRWGQGSEAPPATLRDSQACARGRTSRADDRRRPKPDCWSFDPSQCDREECRGLKWAWLRRETGATEVGGFNPTRPGARCRP
jgi:hypothetical protein